MSTLIQRLNCYERLVRLDKPTCFMVTTWMSILALWFAGNGKPYWLIVWIFLLGGILMHSAGCIINDYADRNFDGHVARTRDRPFPTGEISVKEAVGLFLVLSLLSLGLVLLIGSWLVTGLAIVALIMGLTYPFTKRFFALPQAYLGISFGIGPLMAYAALLGTLPLQAWLLMLANMFWTLAYDTEYAMVDREDDLKIGIRTAAITFGRFDVIAVMICYLCFLSLVSYVGYTHGCGWIFGAGIGVTLLIVVYHYFLIRDRDPVGCLKAFNHNIYVGLTVFLGIVCDYLLRTQESLEGIIKMEGIISFEWLVM